MHHPTWLPLGSLKINPSEAHLLKVELDTLPEGMLKEAEALLSKDELFRANRFKFPIHKRRYILVRGFLRSLLAKATGLKANTIEFTYGQQGKPYLKEHPIEFNLSHSDELAVFAFSTVPIGVDVEKIKPCEALKLAQRFFAHEEAAMLNNTSESEQLNRFYHIWTLKEAVIKTTGLGLTQALDSFAVTLPAALTRMDQEHSHAWQLNNFLPKEGYVGALAAQANLNAFHYWTTDTL